MSERSARTLARTPRGSCALARWRSGWRSSTSRSLVVVRQLLQRGPDLRWPPSGLTLEWWRHRRQRRRPYRSVTSVKVGLGATAVALVLGTCRRSPCSGTGSSAGTS